MDVASNDSIEPKNYSSIRNLHSYILPVISMTFSHKNYFIAFSWSVHVCLLRKFFLTFLTAENALIMSFFLEYEFPVSKNITLPWTKNKLPKKNLFKWKVIFYQVESYISKKMHKFGMKEVLKNFRRCLNWKENLSASQEYNFTVDFLALRR